MAHTCCEKEREILKEELKNLDQQVKQLKKEYHILLVENLQKDVIIREKKKQTEQKKYINSGLPVEYLEILNSFGNSEREDSAFIAAALNGVYKGESETIKHKSLSGRSKLGETTAITPTKKLTLENLFAERLSYIPVKDTKRQKNLNRLICDAIHNAKRRK